MKRIAFFGTPEIAAQSLNALLKIDQIQVSLVITQPDKPAGRNQQVTESAVKKLALANNLAVIQPKSAKNELLEQLKQYGDFDGAVVVAYGQILPQGVLKFFKEKCINVHYSLLPRWRGAAPVQHAILNGDSQTGVCLMKMETGLDTGPVYVTENCIIDRDDTTGTLISRLAEIGCSLLSKNIVEILEDKVVARTQSIDGVTLAAKISKEDTKIIWSESAEQIERKIRAFAPTPTAYTMLEGVRFRLLKATALTAQARFAPGTISAIGKELLVVQTGNGQLSLELIQKEGRPILSVAEFMRGAKISTGTVLG